MVEYYRPSEHDQISAEEMKKSLALIEPTKSQLGDFSFQKLTWEDNTPPPTPTPHNPPPSQP